MDVTEFEQIERRDREVSPFVIAAQMAEINAVVAGSQARVRFLIERFRAL